MIIGYKEKLKEYGYDVESQGYIYFEDLLVDCIEMINDGKDIEYIKEIFPSCCLEYFHFFYEVGNKKYFRELEKFCNKELNDTISPNRVKKQEKELPSMDVFDTVMYFANQFSNKEKQENKVYTYKKNKNKKNS